MIFAKNMISDTGLINQADNADFSKIFTRINNLLVIFLKIVPPLWKGGDETMLMSVSRNKIFPKISDPIKKERNCPE